MNEQLLKRRYRFEFIFKLLGRISLLISCAMLIILIGGLIFKGYNAFWRNEILLPVYFDPILTKENKFDDIITNALRETIPTFADDEKVRNFLSIGSEYTLSDFIAVNPNFVGKKVVISIPVSHSLDDHLKNISLLSLNKIELQALELLYQKELIAKKFNSGLFTHPDSREPEIAGLASSIIGSLYVIIICLFVTCPIGIFTGVYLEEYAPKNKITDLIEININNLAAVPSIVFGLLGLTIFINLLDVPRSSALAGGLTLSLMVLPTIVITTRQALKTVPKSIKEGVMALGATNLQILFHHTLPLALPGIMTGIILSICRALGETAPLLIIGMVAFMAEIPNSLTHPSTVLPVQIFLWSKNPEVSFVNKTSAAILVLLAILVVMNILAVTIRKKYEKRW